MGFLVGVDIGGTFTDCAIVDDGGAVTLGKTPSTPADPAAGFFNAVADGAERLGLPLAELLSRTTGLVHGTTVGTNAIVAETGVRVGILTTRGHRDALHIMDGYGRTAGLTIEELAYIPGTDKPRPIVPRERIFEVTERINAAGEVVVALNEEEVRDAIAALVADGVEAIGVAFLWSFVNPDHEQRAKRLVEALAPGVFIGGSSELVPRIGEYSRTATLAMNCYIGPLMERYVERLRSRAEELGLRGGLRFSQCGGGTGTPESVKRAPIHTVQSGPAVGVVGSAYLGRQMGYPNIITADMGGTTFDVGLVEDGEPVTASTSILRQYELYLPTVDIQSVGAGGGSIAWIDGVGGLRVGPASAGAQPGPACYGLGGADATVTDADVVLGIINPGYFLGGRLRLDAGAARAAIARLADQLGLGVLETAAGISQIVDARMANQVRRMVVNRGRDPRDFVLFAFGGGGPTHASTFAREVGVPTVVVPMGDVASVWSALGAATSNIVYYFDQTVNLDAPFDADAVGATLARLERAADDRLARDGVPESDRRFLPSAFLKFGGQVFETEVALPTAGGDPWDLIDRFHRRYDEIYGIGTGFRGAGVTMTGLRVKAVGETPKPRLCALPEEGATPSSAARAPARPVYWFELGRQIPTPVYRGEQLLPGNAVDGPAIIEVPDTTVTVRPGDVARVDGYRNLILQLGPAR
jgi:N-methylhydantoinase A